ncbi:uncharacterized protein LOC128731548 [Anopheles nili]|uniref:uncharacterized protein LOC128731548 n=1 Tax=Anopheles nili TaxID=185578 RepID=UPI00237AA24C|nr:uncharacterized protein LOC128731548 [Anopheles nili]
MQSLETSACQEADFILNDAYCKLKKSPSRQTTLLIDPSPQYPNLPSPLLNDNTPLFHTSSSEESPHSGSISSTYATLNPSHHSTSPPAILLASPSSTFSSPTDKTAVTDTPTGTNSATSTSSSTVFTVSPKHVDKRVAPSDNLPGYGSSSPAKKSKFSSPFSSSSMLSSSSTSSASSSLLSSSSPHSSLSSTASAPASSSFHIFAVSPSVSQTVLFRQHHQHPQQHHCSLGGGDSGGNGNNISGNGNSVSNSVLQQTQKLLVGCQPFESIPVLSGFTTGSEKFNIHEKLRELYFELLTDDTREGNRLSLKNTSFLLEKLIVREQLNTLIVNLYPGNKGYSLAFRMGSQDDGRGRSMSKTGGSTVFSTMGTGVSTPPAAAISSTHVHEVIVNSCELNLDENLQETIRWSYEEEDLLDCIDREELPLVLVDILETKCPALFYCGCVVAEIRDYRQSFPIFTCDTFHVLLKPTNQTLLADVNLLTADGEWSAEDKLMLESQLVLATAEPLCLDPNPAVGVMNINQQHRRQMLNTAPIRRQAKKFSQIAVNRKRKTDQFTHNFGLELSDFITKYRSRPPTRSHSTRRGVVSFTVPKKPSEIIPAVNLPTLELPDLSTPSEVNVEKHARKYEAPKESRDCIPQLIEEYILETDRIINRADTRVYHIKLSIFQRPSNSEYLGELYVDRDYRENERNGEACQFSLGTRAHAHRYIQQFTEIFTEEGRKSVKITHLVPGQVPKVLHTAGMREQNVQQQQLQLQQQLQQQQLLQQQQHSLVQQQISQIQQRLQSHPTQALLTRLQATNPALASQIATATGVNGPQVTLNAATNVNTTLPACNSQIQSQTSQQSVATTQPIIHQNLSNQQLISATVPGPNISISIGSASVSNAQPQQTPQPAQQPQLLVQSQQHLLATTNTHQPQMFTANACEISNAAASTSVSSGVSNATANTVTTSTIGPTITLQPQSSVAQQHTQQGQQTLNLTNGSLLLVQPSGQISNLTMATNATVGQQHLLTSSTGAGGSNSAANAVVSGTSNFTFSSSGARTLGNAVPLLVRLDNAKMSRDGAGNLISTVSQQVNATAAQMQIQTQQQNTQNHQQQQHLLQQSTQQQNQSGTIHTTNPEIKAIAISIMNSANQFTNRQQQQSSSKASSNAAILSLLNSAPAAMTNSPVLSTTLALPAGKSVTDLHQHPQHQQPPQQHTIHHHQGTGNGGSAAATIFSSVAGRKINIQQAQQANQTRILNHANLIAVTGGTGGTNQQTQLINIQASDMQQHQQQQHSVQTTTQQQTQQQNAAGSIRVTMSALATQLASPPAILTTSNLPQSFNVAAAAAAAAAAASVSGSNSSTVSATNTSSFASGGSPAVVTSAGSKLIINSSTNQRVLNINANSATSNSTQGAVVATASAFGGTIRRVSGPGNAAATAGSDGLQLQIQGLTAAQISSNLAASGQLVKSSAGSGGGSDGGLRRSIVVADQLQIQSITSPAGSDHSNTSSTSLTSNNSGANGGTNSSTSVNANNIIFNNMSGLNALLANTTTSAGATPPPASSSLAAAPGVGGVGEGTLQNPVTVVGLGVASNNTSSTSNNNNIITSSNCGNSIATTVCGGSSNSALIERLTSSSSINIANSSSIPTVQSPGLQFTIPSPKTPQQQPQGHMQIQSPVGSISPLSSPPPQITIQPPQQQQLQQPSQQSQHAQHVQQTQAQQQQSHQPTTVNLQGLNFASLHGAMTSIPGLQNVQVQIPGLAQPISLSLSSAPSAATTTGGVMNNTPVNNAGQATTTSLLVSVPVTNTTQVVNTINAGNTNNLLSGNSQATQTVVLTNPQTSGSSLLSLPIAQIVSSGMKGISQHSMRASAGQLTGQPGQQIQLLNISQRSRTGQQLPIMACSGGPSSITTKQLAARVAQHRQQMATVAGSTLKIATPITATHAGQLNNPLSVTTGAASNQIVMTTKQLQLKLQQQQQAHQIIAAPNGPQQPGATQIHIQHQTQTNPQVIQQQQHTQPQANQQISILNNTVMTPLSLSSPVAVATTVTGSQPASNQNINAISASPITAAGKHRRRSGAADTSK